MASEPVFPGSGRRHGLARSAGRMARAAGSAVERTAHRYCWLSNARKRLSRFHCSVARSLVARYAAQSALGVSPRAIVALAAHAATGVPTVVHRLAPGTNACSRLLRASV